MVRILAQRTDLRETERQVSLPKDRSEARRHLLSADKMCVVEQSRPDRPLRVMLRSALARASVSVGGCQSRPPSSRYCPWYGSGMVFEHEVVPSRALFARLW